MLSSQMFTYYNLLRTKIFRIIDWPHRPREDHCIYQTCRRAAISVSVASVYFVMNRIRVHARRDGRDLARNAHLSCTPAADPHGVPRLDEIAWEHELLPSSRQETASPSFFIYCARWRCFLQFCHHGDGISKPVVRALSFSCSNSRVIIMVSW